MVNQIDFAGGTEHTETPSVPSPGHEQEFNALASPAVSPLIVGTPSLGYWKTVGSRPRRDKMIVAWQFIARWTQTSDAVPLGTVW